MLDFELCAAGVKAPVSDGTARHVTADVNDNYRDTLPVDHLLLSIPMIYTSQYSDRG